MIQMIRKLGVILVLATLLSGCALIAPPWDKEAATRHGGKIFCASSGFEWVMLFPIYPMCEGLPEEKENPAVRD